jgi:hypothetical protein
MVGMHNPLVQAGIVEERLPNGKVRVRLANGDLIEATFINLDWYFGKNTLN